ncbi:MAG: hypothetical protein ABI333_13440 [bacterium]
MSVLLGVATTACVEEIDHVVVALTADGLDIAHELDTLEITVTASSNAAGTELCEPHTIYYSLDPGDATHITLPFQLEITPGSIYDKLLYLRVVGKHYGTARFKTERAASLAGGDSVLNVSITADCLGVGTGYGQHCQGGVATDSPFAAIFDEGQYVEAGEACRAPE